ncbi:MAG: hypothetical protein IPN75_17805 [Dechloromonas sp.]|uniref:Uncharacterized protein n=1 Tax=Candidatus Dechloromonas phosphorivorans TaxID=2899244 RepID=A0A9D7LQT7_9RHOO|nr:hypothetical protein [Candidatus Dechloromonas phosphorivorans]
MSEELLMRFCAYPELDDHIADHERTLDTLAGIALNQPGDPAAAEARLSEIKGFLTGTFALVTLPSPSIIGAGPKLGVPIGWWNNAGLPGLLTPCTARNFLNFLSGRGRRVQVIAAVNGREGRIFPSAPPGSASVPVKTGFRFSLKARIPSL